MRRLDIDFAQRRARWPAWVLLALGLAVAGDASWRYWELRDAQAQVQQRRSAASRRAPPPAPPPDERTQRELAAARQVLQELALPWDALLRDIEAALGEHAALLAIEPDASRRLVRVSGEARRYADAIEFMQRLDAAPTLMGVHLQNHQVRDDVPERPVQFTLGASWRMQP